MNEHKDLLLEVAEQMETLSLFADQVAWDSIVSRVKAAANIDEPTGRMTADQTQTYMLVDANGLQFTGGKFDKLTLTPSGVKSWADTWGLTAVVVERP